MKEVIALSLVLSHAFSNIFNVSSRGMKRPRANISCNQDVCRGYSSFNGCLYQYLLLSEFNPHRNI